jgi:hypothetical protein
MGFGMWLAHYAFHFLTGGLTVVPVVQSFLADIGRFGGRVQWGLGPLVPADWLFPIEAILLYIGASGSLIAVFQIARDQSGSRGGSAGPSVLRAALPWAGLVLVMLAVGLWILVQPMEMRGTMMMPVVRGNAGSKGDAAPGPGDDDEPPLAIVVVLVPFDRRRLRLPACGPAENLAGWRTHHRRR